MKIEPYMLLTTEIYTHLTDKSLPIERRRHVGYCDKAEQLANKITGDIHRFESVPVPVSPFHSFTLALYVCLWCGAGFVVTPAGFVMHGLTLPKSRNCRGDDA